MDHRILKVQKDEQI